MKSFTRTLIATGLIALAGGCGVKQPTKHDFYLDQVFVTSENKVWATRTDERRGQLEKINLGYLGPQGDTVIYKDMPTDSKPLCVNYYDAKNGKSFAVELHLPKGYRFGTSSERVHRGKTTVEIDNVELGGQN